jgi:hypothetical protein
MVHDHCLPLPFDHRELFAKPQQLSVGIID